MQIFIKKNDLFVERAETEKFVIKESGNVVIIQVEKIKPNTTNQKDKKSVFIRCVK